MQELNRSLQEFDFSRPIECSPLNLPGAVSRGPAQAGGGRGGAARNAMRSGGAAGQGGETRPNRGGTRRSAGKEGAGESERTPAARAGICDHPGPEAARKRADRCKILTAN